MSDDIKKILEDVQKLGTELKTEMQSKKADDEKVNRMIDAHTKDLEALQKAQAEAKAQAERIEKLEAAMNRVGNEGKDGQDADLETKKSFERFVRDGEMPKGMKFNDDGGLEIRSMATETDTAGGYLVMPQLANFLVGRV